MSTRAQSGPEPFGTYLLDRLIAEGGMARVYLARLRGVAGFEKALVVKQIKPVFAQDPEFVALFVQEAKTLVRLSHPHVVPIYELGVVDGTYFIAMEYVDGVSLLELMRTAKDGRLPPAIVAHILVQTAEALRHAHERFGMVHRDITPRNIMIDRGGNVRLVDFGIATPVSPPELRSDQGETRMDASPMFGSPGYMAPEQVRGAPVDGKCDVFALGCVGYEALEGNPAFYSSEPDEALTRVLEERARVSVQPDVGVDAALAELLDATLEPDASARPDAGAVASRLRAWLSAAVPGGVAPRLAERVEALLHRRAAAAEEPPLADPGTPLRPVKTLATAAVLREARGGSPEESGEQRARGGPDDVRDGGDGDPPSGAQTPRPDEEREDAPPSEGTVPIAGRRGAPPPTDPSPDPDDAPSGRVVRDEGTQRRDERTAGRTDAAGRATEAADETEATPSADPRKAPEPGARPRTGFVLTVALAACCGALVAWGVQRASNEASGPGLGMQDAVVADAGVMDAAGVGSGRGRDTPGTPDGVDAGYAPADAGAAPRDANSNLDAGPARADSAPASASRTASGTILVRATPWASVQVDGRSLGRGARVSGTLPPGTHRMTLRCQPLGTSVTTTVRVSPGRTTRVTADLSAPPGRVRVH